MVLERAGSVQGSECAFVETVETGGAVVSHSDLGLEELRGRVVSDVLLGYIKLVTLLKKRHFG